MNTPPTHAFHRSPRWQIVLLWGILTGIGAQTAEPAPPPLSLSTATEIAAQWGIAIASLHLSAQGNLVDFRYNVLDPAKAATLSDPQARPYLIDQASGTRLLVPSSPKLGPLRLTGEKPVINKVYFVLFTNVGKAVKVGSKVSIVIGTCRIDNLTVE